MVGLAPDDAAQRDIAVVARSRRIATGLLRQRDGRRNLQCARNGDDVELNVPRAQGILRAFQQRVSQVVIEARLDDENAGRIAQDWSSPCMSRHPVMRRP